MAVRAAAIGVVACLLNGCATPPAPGTSGTPVDIPSEWSSGDTSDSGARPSARWWHDFDDPRLDLLVQSTLARNHDLEAAAARIRQAQAQARIVGADRYPRFEGALGLTRSRQSPIGLPASRDAGFIATSYGVSLNAAWEIDLWDRIGQGRRAAVSAAQAVRAEYAAARLSLSGQAVKLYFALIQAQRQLELARRTLEIRQSTSARVRRRYEAGLVPPLDLRLALSAQAAAAVLVSTREREFDSMRRQLEIVVGTYPRAALDTAASFPGLAPAPAVGVPAELLVRRPDLVAAELRIEAQGARAAAARAALLPQVRLSASIGRRASNPADLFDAGLSVWSLAADLLAPIFQGGRLRAEIDLAHARLAEALAQYRKTLLEAFLEVETALAADRHYAEETAAALRRLDQAQAAARLAQDQYGAGLVDLLSVFEAERQRLEAASQALASQGQRLQARVDLYLALGGGFDAS